MFKSIINNWPWEHEPVDIIKRQPTMLIKSGSWYRVYKQDPDNTYVNALFLGSDEYWGSNNNGDAFEEEELIKSHHTFVDHANHFKHHENDDPSNSYGKVCETYYNPNMHRVEGVIKIIIKKSPDMLERIDRGLMVPLSMACRVLFDRCSLCQNKAKRTEDYCDDLKFNMNKILSDGRKIRAFNPNPVFFDISEVSRGADSTAFTLKKVAAYYDNFYDTHEHSDNKFCKCASENRNKLVLASNNGCLYNNLDIGMLHKKTAEKTLANNEKKAILEQMAAIEKKIEIGIRRAEPGIKILSKGICIKELPEKHKKDNGHVGAMSKTGIAMFTKLPGRTYMYRNLLKEAVSTDLFSYIPSKSEIYYRDELDGVTGEMSNLEKYALGRIMTGSHKKVSKSTDNKLSSELFKVACINLAAICNNPGLMQDKFFPELTVLQNFCS